MTKLRKQLAESMMTKLIEYDLFDDKGSLIISSRQDMIKQAFLMAILEQAKDKDFDPHNLFNPQSIKLLIKINNPDEIKEFKEFLIRLKNNLELTIKELPD